MNDAFLYVNDVFVYMNDALVYVNDAFVCVDEAFGSIDDALESFSTTKVANILLEKTNQAVPFTKSEAEQPSPKQQSLSLHAPQRGQLTAWKGDQTPYTLNRPLLRAKPLRRK